MDVKVNISLSKEEDESDLARAANREIHRSVERRFLDAAARMDGGVMDSEGQLRSSAQRRRVSRTTVITLAALAILVPFAVWLVASAIAKK